VPDDDVGSVTNDDVRSAWDALAGWWDGKMEAGETWQRRLIAPAVEELLAIAKGERVLELACGNGEFARRLTGLGADMLASDFSEPMLERARSRADGIDYRRVDATDQAAMLALGEPGSFDAAVSNMAIMDMIDIEPMARAVHTLVRTGGRFVVSTLHPAFNSGDIVLVTDEELDSRGITRTHSVKRSTYIRASTDKGVGLEDQPVMQWYFHRSLQDILAVFFGAGWVLDGLAEPVLEESSTPFAELPGVLVVRFARR
jgi:2-polyprenyl-3-methyl-5-hydroxy-6-metoxy-1,4-benzoquinol methylase